MSAAPDQPKAPPQRVSDGLLNTILRDLEIDPASGSVAPKEGEKLALDLRDTRSALVDARTESAAKNARIAELERDYADAAQDIDDLDERLSALRSDRDRLERERDEAREHVNHGLTSTASEIDKWQFRHSLGTAKLAAAYERMREMAELVECLVDNDPDEPISDGGHVVLDLWRHDARRVLADYRNAAPADRSRTTEGGGDG